jgi:hypothetical protein
VVRGGHYFCFSVFSSSSSCLLLVLLSVLFFYCSSFTLLSLFSLLAFLSFPLCSPLSFFFFSHPPLVHCLFLAFIGQLNALWW